MKPLLSSLSSLWFYVRAFGAFVLLAVLALGIAWQDITTRDENEVDT